MRNFHIMQIVQSLSQSCTARVTVVTLLALLLSEPSPAQLSIQIVNGAPELAEPTTGGLLMGPLDSGYLACSATLIGCDVAITTAHCFNVNAAEKNFLFFQHAGFIPIESATRHPAYVAAFPPNFPDFDVLRVEDIAFIKLAEPVTGITPSSLVQLGAPAIGTPGKIVGFGRDPITAVSPASADANAGIKRSGTMTVSACEGTLVGQDVLCWQLPDPPVPLGPTGIDVSTCEGDSGGPLFVTESGQRVVAGITKGAVFIQAGQSDLCEPPVDPFDTNVDRHRNWIEGPSGTGGMVSTTGAIPFDQKDCGPLEQLPELVQSGDVLGDCDGSAWSSSPAPRTCGFSGFLDVTAVGSTTHSFPVPAGTSLLRVAFNGIASSSGSVDTNYYLRGGAPATTTLFDCAAAGTGTLGFCEISNPSADTWHTLIDQTLFRGEYQVTVTMFGPPPPSTAVSSLDSATRMLLIGAMLVLPLVALREHSRRRSRSGSGSPAR